MVQGPCSYGIYIKKGAVREPPLHHIFRGLFQNNPNPFNPATTISYEIGGTEPVNVRLKIYDLRGKVIRQLVSGIREPGQHTVFWDGNNASGFQVSSGVYLYRMTAGDLTITRKMVILK